MKSVATRHPLEWGIDNLRAPAVMDGTAASAVVGIGSLPAPRTIGFADLRAALAAGLADFAAFRTDVIFLCIMYPVAGLVLGKIVVGRQLLQLAFPLVAGFTLLGPLLATGLYEMSRRRADGREVAWTTAFEAFRSPAIGSILALGMGLLLLFGAWLLAAQGIYDVTLGPLHPASPGAFVHALFTPRGNAMIIAGMGVGFVFAAAALSLSAVSFPLLLDRNVGVETAVRTSWRAMRANPGTMAMWGFIVAAGLLLGSLPLLMGLAIVVPVLGHATWHLYRRILPDFGVLLLQH